MTSGRFVVAIAAAVALALPGVAGAQTGLNTTTLRTVAARLITAELSGDGATVCGVLYAPLTGTVDGKTCVQRWDARSARLLAAPGGAGRLRADLRALARAAITMNGEHASIALPHPLLAGHTDFYWTANCWMLTR
jgi:hypothetical protein